MQNFLNGVFNYIVSPENIKFICEEIKDCKIKFIVLMTDENTLLQRDKERPVDCRMGERCITLLNSFKNKNYHMSNVLFTTNLSIDETIRGIEMDNRFYLN